MNFILHNNTPISKDLEWINLIYYWRIKNNQCGKMHPAINKREIGNTLVTQHYWLHLASTKLFQMNTFFFLFKQNFHYIKSFVLLRNILLLMTLSKRSLSNIFLVGNVDMNCISGGCFLFKFLDERHCPQKNILFLY